MLGSVVAEIEGDTTLGRWAATVAAPWPVLFLWPLGAGVRVPGRLAALAALAAGRVGGGRRRLRDLLPADLRPRAHRRRRRPRAAQPAAAADRRLGAADLLGLLGRAAGVAVRRGGRDARPLQGGRRAAAPAGPVARLRRAADPGLARRQLAAGADRVPDRGRRRRAADAAAGLAGGRGGGRDHPPRAVLDRPARQPHARLRRADRAAGGDLRARLAADRAGRRRLEADGLAGDDRRRAGLPAAARPAAAAGRPPLLAAPLRRRADAARLPRRGPPRPRRARGRRRGDRARARRPAAPRSSSSCPRPPPTRTATGARSSCPTTAASAR